MLDQETFNDLRALRPADLPSRSLRRTLSARAALTEAVSKIKSVLSADVSYGVDVKFSASLDAGAPSP